MEELEQKGEWWNSLISPHVPIYLDWVHSWVNGKCLTICSFKLLIGSIMKKAELQFVSKCFKLTLFCLFFFSRMENYCGSRSCTITLYIIVLEDIFIPSLEMWVSASLNTYLRMPFIWMVASNNIIKISISFCKLFKCRITCPFILTYQKNFGFQLEKSIH